MLNGLALVNEVVPLTARAVNVPRVVTFGCAAVVSVPTIRAAVRVVIPPSVPVIVDAPVIDAPPAGTTNPFRMVSTPASVREILFWV